ncbi:MAG: oligosaccharide flippase family protein [Candidatus Daviesbacteria bacterium]|nr:oligosaccharide flippase family protein [Candidatus Daviesbacteria bacterium]
MEESVEQKGLTEELTPEKVNSKVKKGIAILTIRTIFIQAIAFLSNVVILPLLLLPAQYGVFFLVSAVISFLAYFSDIGFAASLIQKKDMPTDRDLKTIFTTQQVMVIGIIVIVLLATPLFKNFYQFDDAAFYLLWALALSLFLSSLKTIPSVLLERRLEFNKLVIPQIFETIIFNLSVVYFAWQGFGVTSFTIGVLLRGVIGVIATYIVQPWIPGLSFSFQSFKSVLKFGIPYQTNTFLAMIKDDGMTLFLGSTLGVSGIGLLGWAQKWAYAPLRFFMDQVIKVTFPAFSRLQNDKKELSNAVSKSIFFICLLVFPSLVLLVLLVPSLTQIIPKYHKWSPALLALGLISITSAFAAVTTPLTNMLNAIGKISLTFKFMVMWTVLTWIFVPLLSYIYGVNGAAFGFSIVGASSIVALIKSKEFIDINYLEVAGKPLLGALTLGLLVFILKILLPTTFISVILIGILGIALYTGLMFIIEPSLLKLVKNILNNKK